MEMEIDICYVDREFVHDSIYGFSRLRSIAFKMDKNTRCLRNLKSVFGILNHILDDHILMVALQGIFN